ncbi:flagellar filament capping protein FliD [Cellulomonas fimi]|uniref:Flagellar hook-associated protein 2 n=1 Tax=Cellulomonas fimi TaxID=1708 RepID=A0A7Y0QI70_CELFI|nr:flagellar filament capping protein FliD [Cellulomonas fimi]NMR21030.1 flagellar filament capping protein FliD [Cellulomonas fimi]
MAVMGIDGLASGLDTTGLINSLMKVEAMPQTLLKAKVTTTQSYISALQSLNTKVSSLAEAAKTAATPAKWDAVTANSSAKTVTATTSAGAQASSLSFTVDALATGQTSVSAAVTDLAGFFGPGTVPGSVTLVSGSGPDATLTAVDLDGVTDLAGFARAVNEADAGITATVVKVSDTQSRLQLTSKATGEPAAFDVYRDTVTADTLATGTKVVDRAAAITSAANARITLWKGTAAEQSVTSATNTFSGVLTGVDLTVTAKEADPVTLTIARDDAAVKKLASGLVGALGVVLSEVRSRTATTTTTSEDGRTVISGGVLSGDSATRALQQSVLNAASYPVDGVSPSEVGIVLGRDGTVTFDEAKFSAAMAADPAKVQGVVVGLAARVETAAKTVSDPIDGTLSLQIKNQESFSKSLSEQVSDWERRLEQRREGLQRTYAALEVTLSGLNSQSNWLAGQLAGLSSSSA